MPAAFQPPAVAGEIDATDWDEVNRRVHLQLQDLDRKLAQLGPNRRVEYGSSHGRIFPLYSHASFTDATDPQKLAIVVGLDFHYGPVPGTLNIRAEMVREEEGDILFQEIATDVPNRKLDVLAKAEELGRRLNDQHTLLAAALGLSPSGANGAT